MTVNDIIDFVAGKFNRTSNNTQILAGINWVKNDLLTVRLRRQWRKGDDITLVSGQYDDYDLPAKFGMLDKFQIVLSSSNKYELVPAHNAEEITEYPYSGYPEKYFFYGDNKFMVGAPAPGSALTLRPFYYETIDDYTASDTTPVLADRYGAELYIRGASSYLWDYLEQYDRAKYEKGRYLQEKNKIIGLERDNGVRWVNPNRMF